ncbi:aromatic ring-hydroxylating dioxygenase subunit alpha [Novosphingobium cyanobacteriorum]|uniref:Aromatic ring-hydroxylating dioxygenase subunit alpha n=1 Tax=Novosphingobium cyanobacteriorum TaxID=3024215 RepID=A0ABT6CEE5_9SPHN|nr:aromatic ring-hydroxylating dioxygenase subunit alpha [Novosphingobium cyanobacteriorum]MDF8332176.1 aromatic ring-hydroxylating dioxygenase subunit alpha [Novosphingobium cyanobacteriorum]
MDNVLRNTWYVAAWASELAQGQLLDRTLLGERLVLYRSQDGAPVALANRCPHRFVPLSMGKLCDGGAAIECAYHGLRFDSRGQCVQNPQGEVPKGAGVRSFPATERFSAIWIWFGDPALADPALVPEIAFLEPETWAVGTGVTEVACHYELESDNIMDLSHIEFLHPMFSSEAVRAGAIECRQDGETVWSRRMIYNDDPPEFIRQAFNIPAGKRVDRWLDARWNAPAVIALWTGGVESGRPREDGIDWCSAHLFTPISENRTMYFWALAFPRSMENAEEMALQGREALRYPFEHEDAPIIEAAHANMGGEDFWALRPLILPGDGGAVRARRLLKSMIAREQAGASARQTQTP